MDYDHLIPNVIFIAVIALGSIIVSGLINRFTAIKMKDQYLIPLVAFILAVIYLALVPRFI